MSVHRPFVSVRHFGGAMVKSGMKTAFVTLLACIVSLNVCFAGDDLAKAQAEIIFLKHMNTQLEKRVSELQGREQVKPEVPAPAPAPRITDADLKAQIAEQASTIEQITLAYEKELNYYTAALAELQGKYTSLVTRWNNQQAAIAQQNAAPAPPTIPAYRGKTDSQKAVEELEGIKFQLQQIQVQNMGK